MAWSTVLPQCKSTLNCRWPNITCVDNQGVSSVLSTILKQHLKKVEFERELVLLSVVSDCGITSTIILLDVLVGKITALSVNLIYQNT